MSASPPPPSPTALACQRDPERWFDPRRRRDALVGCLMCPARRQCAREALSSQADWGMWAGVWIDGHHHDAVPYLSAIANDAAAPVDSPASMDSTADDWAVPTVPLHRPVAARPPSAATTMLLARSSGHCEVLAEGCRFTFDCVVNRCPADGSTENPCAAALFAACGSCADIVVRLEPHLATRSGYLVAAGRDPAAVPFLWRGSRWVLLDRDGWLTEIGDAARSA
jgi:hypothetical protein